MSRDSRRVVVVGGGASGMAAALSAAVSGASVVLVEAAPKCGRSILASGNGRCNFCNADLDPGRYNDPAFVARVMGDRPLEPIAGLFESLGLWYETEDEGRMYPRSRAARSVLDVLETALDSYGVERVLDEKIVRLERVASDARGGASVPIEKTLQVDAIAAVAQVASAPVDGSKPNDIFHSCGGSSLSAGAAACPGWVARGASGAAYEGDALVWAAGGGSGELFAEVTGVALTDLRPALCPLATSPRLPKALDGVRLACEVELQSGRSTVERAAGEVLLRTYGLSGIVVFDLSRLARRGDRLVLDLVPDVGEDRLAELLQERAARLAARPNPPRAAVLLQGAVHPKLGEWLLGPGGPGERADAARLAGLLKRWTFTVEGPGDERQAQVTQGGLANDAFDPLTLEARLAPGLFACGEALDVDGACGGFNLAWAWSSGMVAGRAAALAPR